MGVLWFLHVYAVKGALGNRLKRCISCVLYACIIPSFTRYSI